MHVRYISSNITHVKSKKILFLVLPSSGRVQALMMMIYPQPHSITNTATPQIIIFSSLTLTPTYSGGKKMLQTLP